MNIFALSKNPVKAAKEMLDKHVVKMPTETCQMLHTNALFNEYVDKFGEEPSLRQLKQYHTDTESILMKPAMLNHPSTIWARESRHNTEWLFRHGLALCREFFFRYEKVHGSEKRIEDISKLVNGNILHATPVNIAMLDKYRIPNNYGNHCWEYVIDSYRHYYLEGKWEFAEWRKNRMPEWWPKGHKFHKLIERQNKLHLENERLKQIQKEKLK
tara:strand:- start:859 stop:1500 length:642 start_codon:yes stop_codon:yes gene_type:complete